VLSFYSTVLDDMVGGDSVENNVSKIGRKDRPRGVAIIAILQMIVGFLAFACDVYSINTFFTHFVPGGGAGIAQLIITFGLIIAGAFSLVLGYGIWMGWHWTWLTVVVLDILGIMFSLLILIEVIQETAQALLNNYAFALSETIPVVIVCSTELWYFSREHTRSYFVKWK
jgi:hypothetical protein